MFVCVCVCLCQSVCLIDSLSVYPSYVFIVSEIGPKCWFHYNVHIHRWNQTKMKSTGREGMTQTRLKAKTEGTTRLPDTFGFHGFLRSVGLANFLLSFVYYESLKRELKTKNYIWISVRWKTNLCLLWIVKASAKDKNYIWISVRWKAKN